MLVSVLIPTRNRCAQLRQALQSFEEMQVPDEISWELIIVDNDSSDATRTVVDDAIQRGRVPVHCILQKHKGKSFCLNAALAEAKGSILAFTDDDCIVAPNWVAAMAAEFARDPAIGGLGGRVELYNSLDKPYTIRTSRKPDVLTPWNLIYLIVGCNMAFARRVFEDVGEFDTTLGPGSRCYAAEDFDLLYRAYKRGFRIAYAPDVLVYHNHGRKTDSDIRVLYSRYAISLGAFYCKHILQRDRQMLRMSARHARAMLFSAARRFLFRQPSPPNLCTLRDLLRGAALQVAQRLG